MRKILDTTALHKRRALICGGHLRELTKRGIGQAKRLAMVAEAEKPSTLPSWGQMLRNRQEIRRANSARAKAAHARAKAKRATEKSGVKVR